MEKKSESGIWGIVKVVAIALIVGFIVRQFLFAPIVVDGPSMEPTLDNRDYMIVNKISYRFSDINRFDIIVFHVSEKVVEESEEEFEEKDYIKRVIGLPGEHIEYKNNVLYINGDSVAEPFLYSDNETELADEVKTENFTLDEDVEGNHKVIPEGYILVLGDHRMNSNDSRGIGLISTEEVVGKASFTYWPLNRINFLRK